MNDNGYILESQRGNGIGKFCIDFIVEFSVNNQLSKISLTVNKNNTKAILAYKKIGFKITEDICTDIGAGYVMDDYRMILNV